jgi:site-specific recombinase XerD
MNYRKAVLQYLEYLEIERGRSEKTIANYHHYLERLGDFAGDITTSDIDAELIRKWRLWLNRLASGRGEDLAKVTQNYHLIALRNFLRWCLRRDIATLAPDKIELAKVSRKEVNFLSPDEVERLINSPDSSTDAGLRDKAILELLFSSGLRVSELVGLNREHINLKRREFTVRGKGQKDRPIFVSIEATEWLQKYLDRRTDNLPPLFISVGSHHTAASNDGNFKRLTARSIQRIIQKHALIAGITKHVSPHTLRHSFATDLLMNGADIRSVQTLLGHSSISTTQIYTHITDPHLKAVHEKYHHNNPTSDKPAL